MISRRAVCCAVCLSTVVYAMISSAYRYAKTCSVGCVSWNVRACELTVRSSSRNLLCVCLCMCLCVRLWVCLCVCFRLCRLGRGGGGQVIYPELGWCRAWVAWLVGNGAVPLLRGLLGLVPCLGCVAWMHVGNGVVPLLRGLVVVPCVCCVA